MQPKRYALTQLGDGKQNRRIYLRQDANCPVIVHVKQRDQEERTAVPAWMVNLSEDGCLITSDHFPRKLENAYIIIPGLGSKVYGVVRTQGQYTINVQFTTKLTSDVVNKVSRITVSSPG